ncbi:MAG TPA: hypothetical protein VKA67_00355 [Verrucomicrobiae bacterium]|nr:hypothetical protein [Verrucomicrobiae bacterium]
MKFALPVLAEAVGAKDPVLSRFRLWISSASGLHQAFVILGVFFLVALGVFIWAVSIRKPQRRRFSRWRRSHHHPSPNGLPKSEPTRSRRKRHRKYRSRNPTLAEVGGLPPVHEDEPPPPLL